MTGRLAWFCAFAGIVASAACGASPTPPSTVRPSVTPTPTPAASRVLSLIRGGVSDVVERPIVGVTVRVMDGPQAGASAVTDAAGQFSIAGTFATDVTLSATVDGYLSKTDKIILADGTGPTGFVYFSLASAAPSVHLEPGAYDLTFITDPACTGIPDDQRTVSFSAEVTAARDQPRDSYYSVDLPNDPGNIGFGMGSFGNVLSVDIDMGVFKHVPPSTEVAFTAYGKGTAPTLTPSTVTLTVSGLYDYCTLTTAAAGGTWTSCDFTPADQIVKRAKCASQNHQLVLTRR